MHPLKNANADSRRNSVFLLRIRRSLIGRSALYFHTSNLVSISGIFANLFNLALSAASGDNVSGMETQAKTNPATKMLNAKIDTTRWDMNTASIGDSANPILNPARTRPNDGALQFGGITSDKADRATAIHDMAPLIACDA
mmetsp:Transcript_9742/g.21690  ORF Transcript_9742/g.21690 Transcript_9742/m.21690 type:complete len:141 (+) Transcript_9742:603-1025(+)